MTASSIENIGGNMANDQIYVQGKCRKQILVGVEGKVGVKLRLRMCRGRQIEVCRARLFMGRKD
jgi:hypothetical protein